MTTTNDNNTWGDLPAGMNLWGEVGIGLAHANRAARMAQNDPALQRKIQRNMLIEKVALLHKEVARLEREAGRHKRQAINKAKAAERKILSASKISVAADNNESEVVIGRRTHRKALLESQAELLQKEADTLLESADELAAKASESKREADMAQSELDRLEGIQPRPDDQTLPLEDAEEETVEFD